MSGLLQVEITTARQAVRAQDAGADRLVAVRQHDFGLGAPLPEDVAAMRRAATVELRVLLRLRAGFGTDGGEASRLRGLIWSYLEAGADGFVLGFLNDLGQVDQEVCRSLAQEGDWPWTFDQAIDAAFDPPSAWQSLAGLPRLDSVLTAGSARGPEHGLERLLELAEDPAVARRLIVAGPTPESLPWLRRAGLAAFDLGLMGPDLDTDRLASWRRLV
ncbi:MAG: copper homeostasis protein CutC [Propionibacteriaceae bacterium]|jgi:copper homeostasis protein|nr:copper homeostasis protein CutC [Propionibacteriaceae bacterium]